eukprot:gene1192-2684_t
MSKPAKRSRPDPASPPPPHDRRRHVSHFYSSEDATLPLDTIPELPMVADHAARRVMEYAMLDFRPELNTSSYVNVIQEPQEQEVAKLGMHINLADQTVYPGSFKLHNDTVNMVARLWNCPTPKSFDEYGCYAGAGTVGSTEACLLAGIALKFRWRAWKARQGGLTARQARMLQPNVVISTTFQ